MNETGSYGLDGAYFTAPTDSHLPRRGSMSAWEYACLLIGHPGINLVAVVGYMA